MNKEVREDLRTTIQKKEWIIVFLSSTGECIEGLTKHSNGLERVEI